METQQYIEYNLHAGLNSLWHAQCRWYHKDYTDLSLPKME